MQPFFFAKAERRIEQALYIEENSRPHKIQMLHGHIKEDIPERLIIIPACKAQHPWRNKERAK